VTRIERIGDAVLYLGDCREIRGAIGYVDAVVTSPPYGQQREYGDASLVSDWRGLVSGALAELPDDGKTQVLVNLGLVHREGSVVPYWEPFIRDMKDAGWRHFGWYVWDQMSGMPGDWNGRLAPSFEFVFHFNRAATFVNKTKPTTTVGRQHSGGIRQKNGSIKIKSHDGKAIQPTKIPDSVIRCVRETSHGADAEHPARFPVKFAMELVEPFTLPGETVMDPFMGSGTTGVACVKLGRKFIGIEIEPKYFEIACKRIEQAYAQPDFFVEAPQPKAEQLNLLGAAE
jgi:DNA modification methylase